MRKNAFTLVELLVVVAITAMLIAMLLPALTKAKAAAVTVRCASNLRQISTGFSMYRVDFDDQLPPVDAYASHVGGTIGVTPWCFTKDYQMWNSIGPYLGNPEWGGFDGTDFKKVVSKGKIKGTLWHCPDLRDPGWGGVQPQYDYPPCNGYAESGYLSDIRSGLDIVKNTAFPRPFSRVDQPSAAVHVTDAHSYNATSGKAINCKWLGSALDAKTEALPYFDLYRHNQSGGPVILFADGHAGYQNRQYVLDNLTYVSAAPSSQENFRLP